MYNLMFLYLSYNNLSGSLPWELTEISDLQGLDISFNNFKFVNIPRVLFELPGLYQLSLAGCGIEGRIPEALSKTPGPLSLLDLSSNSLSGTIPPWLGKMTQLDTLNLSRNALTSTIPEEIRNLQDLTTLDLHSNYLTGPIASLFAISSPFPDGNLRTLDLSRNRFTGSIPPNAGDQNSMEQLFLSHNSLTGQIPSSIGMMKQLKALDLGCNTLYGPIPSTLGSLAQLKTLKLNENRLSGEIPNEFLNLTSLLQLNLSHNFLSGRIPHGIPLAKFPTSSYTDNNGLCGDPLPPCSSRA